MNKTRHLILAGTLGVLAGSFALAQSGPTSPQPAIRIEPAPPQAVGAAAVGTGPIVFRWAEWLHDSSFQIDALGEISGVFELRSGYELIAVDHDNFVAGYLYPRRTAQIGDRIGPNTLLPDMQGGGDANLDPAYWASAECYVPLYLTGFGSLGLERHVCSFVRVKIEPTTFQGGLPGSIFMKITKLRNEVAPDTVWIAPRNAHATFNGNQAPGVFPNSQFGWDDLRRRLNWLPQAPHFVAIPDSSVYVVQ